MNYTFHCSEQDKVPRITIDGKRIAVCNFDLSFETETDINSGYYILVVMGYYKNDDNCYEKIDNKMRTFSINLHTKECVEI